MNDLFDIPPAKDPKRIHCHSIEAYHEERKKLSRRAKDILAFVKTNGSPMTDRHIKDAMFGREADMNRVRPRITELIDMGFLQQYGNTKDALTGKTVRVVMLPVKDQPS